MIIDFKVLRVGHTVPFKGVDLIISEVTYRRGGWVRILATLDGETVTLHRNCGCDQPDGEIPVVDLVTETEYLCCVRCRRLV